MKRSALAWMEEVDLARIVKSRQLMTLLTEWQYNDVQFWQIYYLVDDQIVACKPFLVYDKNISLVTVARFVLHSMYSSPGEFDMEQNKDKKGSFIH